jgi:hypothetical protein
VYQHFDDPTLSLIDVARTHVPLKLDGFDLGYVGGRIYFQSKAKAPPSQELSEATPSGAAFFTPVMAPSRCCAAATGSLEGSEKPKPSKALTRIPLDLHYLAPEVILFSGEGRCGDLLPLSG